MRSMDAEWFRSQMKAKGVTSSDVAAAAGRARTGVSHILSGKQSMSRPWVEAFASCLELPVEEVMARAGLIGPDIAKRISVGFSEGDASTWTAAAGGNDRRVCAMAEALGGDRPGIDVWRVNTPALSLMGYLTGDFMLVDTHAAERTGTGDVVLAQVYTRDGGAQTVLRRYEPPVLVAASPEPADQRVHFVDRRNVVIMGKVVASWRA